MSVDKDYLLPILHIGHDTSMRGEGLSLRVAIARSGYERVRNAFDALDLVPLIQANPELTHQWVMYSQDKRTTGGYWISEDRYEVGAVNSPEGNKRYNSLEEAIAEYVVREIGFWFEICQKPTT